jgi:hypothetical protein
MLNVGELHLRFFEDKIRQASRTLGAKTSVCDRAQYNYRHLGLFFNNMLLLMRAFFLS